MIVAVLEQMLIAALTPIIQQLTVKHAVLLQHILVTMVVIGGLVNDFLLFIILLISKFSENCLFMQIKNK